VALSIRRWLVVSLIGLAAFDAATHQMKEVRDKMILKNSVLSLLVAGSLCSAPAVAQVNDTHKGLWLSFGAGGGWMGSERSATTYFRMGGTPNSRVLFGGQVLHWWLDENVQHSSVTATFSVYPFYKTRGRRSLFQELFVKTGFGVATADCHGHDLTGVALNLGTGFDLRLNRNFFVTPNLDYSIDFFDESTHTSFLFSLGLSWH
jgi:hypothetical protein